MSLFKKKNTTAGSKYQSKTQKLRLRQLKEDIGYDSVTPSYFTLSRQELELMRKLILSGKYQSTTSRRLA